MGNSHSSPKSNDLAEWRWMLVVLFLFGVFNILTAPYSPNPWLDEVSYTDPAASLALNGNLTSTLWGTSGEPLWTGNVPLHQLILAVFFKLFGFSCRVTRSVNIIYYVMALGLISWAVKYYQFINTPKMRWLFFLILLTGTGLTALYRNGRYDTIGFLLFTAWVLFSLQSQRRTWMLLGVFLTTFLMPAASLVLGPTLILFGIAAFILWRKKTLRVLLFTGIGGATGMIVMLLIYQHLGVANIFKSVVNSSNGGTRVFADFTMATIKNPSYGAAIMVFLLVIIGSKRILWREPRLQIAFVLAALGILIPPAIYVAGKYQFYYSWIGILPATLGAVVLLEQLSISRNVRLAGTILLILAATLGFPRRCGRIFMSWKENIPAAVEQFALKNASPTDIVYIDAFRDVFPVYYSLRARVKNGYWGLPPIDESNLPKVSVAFYPGTGYELELEKKFGGNWRQVDQKNFGGEKSFLADPPFQLIAYRRF